MLLTSWQVEESMYLDKWESYDLEVVMKNGSIDWGKVQEEDHH